MNVVNLKIDRSGVNLHGPSALSREVDKIINGFSTWLRLHNRTLSDMNPRDITKKLYEFGGIGSGPVTPRTVEAGRRQANPVAVETALGKLRELEADGSLASNKEEPMLPPGMEKAGHSSTKPPAQSPGKEPPMIPGSVQKQWNEQNKK